MTQQQIAERMTHYAPLTRGQAYDALRALICVVVHEVGRGNACAISGFGLFEPGSKESGETYLRFRQHKSLRSELNPRKPGLKTSVNRAATRSAD